MLDRGFIKRLYAHYSEFNSAFSSTEEKAGMNHYDEFIYEYLIANANIKNDVICDLGCGTGKKLSSLTAAGFMHLIGCDPLCENFKNDSTLLVKSDIAVFLENSTESSIDFVIMNAVAEHLSPIDLEKILLELKRVLKNNGIVIIKSPNCASPFGGFYQYGDLTHIQQLTPNSIAQYASLCGYEHAGSFDEKLALRDYSGLKKWAIVFLDVLFKSLLVFVSYVAYKTKVVLTPNFITILKLKKTGVNP